jgi:cell shape-determining protein MreC
MIGGGAIVLVALLQIAMPHFLPSLFTTIARPFWRMEFSFGSGSLESPESLLAENEALKVRIQELSVENASTDSIRSQNAELLSALGRSDLTMVPTNETPVILGTSSQATTTSAQPAVHGDLGALLASLSQDNGKTLAAVLVRPPLAAYDELIIDVGADKGIVPGSKVYGPGNVLVGTTSDVLGETSKVTLFSSPGQTYPVFIGSDHIPATAIGRGGGQYEAQVPQATSINEGDIVTDSSLGDGAFGKVVSVINNPADPFITVLFAPEINVYQLRWVFVANGKTIAAADVAPKPDAQASTANHSTTSKTSAKKK